jgi:hypothetical protein
MVFQHVKLRPELTICAAGDFLDRTDRDGRQRIGDAGGRRGARRLNLAAPRICAGGADRAEPDRHRPFLSHDFRFKARRPNAAKHALAKIDGPELLDILLHGVLGDSPAVDIVEEKTGQAPFGG